MTLIGGMWVITRVTDSKERAQPTSGLAIARAVLPALQYMWCSSEASLLIEIKENLILNVGHLILIA